MGRHLLVGNPTAQSGKNKARIEHALRLLRSRGVEVDALATLPHGQTIGAVASALRNETYAVVVAMGGDGTFREVAAGILAAEGGESVALGMLPTGTANDQGKSFGLDARESALEENVGVIVRARETRLDAGRIRAGSTRDAASPAEFFFDSAGWGLAARVLAQRNQDREVVASLGPLREIYRDHAVYAGALLKTFLESYVVDGSFNVHARLDDEQVVFEGITDLVIKNTRVYAGAWVLDRSSEPNDGLFEVVPFYSKGDWASRAVLDLEGNPVSAEVLGKVGVEPSRPARASRIELEMVPGPMRREVLSQIDGEEWRSDPYVAIEVLPRAIRLLVP